jgi:hypothetical protein
VTILEPTAEVAYAVPTDQPNTVHEIAERLFPAYRMDGGSLHLAGCTLEDQPFVRLTFRTGDRTREIYVDWDGREADAKQIDTLNLADTAPLETTRELPESELRRLIDCGSQLMAKRLAEADRPELVGTTVICCKYARGKIRFSAGEHWADLPFSSWARLLKPPPFLCPHTGKSTFHLATTDDGLIAAAEWIETCAETGLRVLSHKLLTCSVTGRRVLAELVTECPVCCEPVLNRELVPCSTCGERVSPAELTRGQCSACRNVTPTTRDDPRLARMLAKYPAMENWPRWRMSETASVYIAVAARLLRRILMVVDKESLGIRRLATGSRPGSGWSVLEPADYSAVLGK